MLPRQGDRALRLRYRAACEAGAAYRFASHANPGKGQPGGNPERGTLALVPAQRKIDYRNDARLEGTTLEGTLGGFGCCYAPARAMEALSSFFCFVFMAGLPSLWISPRTCEIKSATSNGLASDGTPCS